MGADNLQIFALNASRDFGTRVAAAAGARLGEHEERDFEDGEHKARPLRSVRGADVYVVQSLYGDTLQTVNDKLVRLLFFLGAIKDAAAGRVTAVVPYLCYARKDRKTKSRDPVSMRYVAGLFEAVGVDRVVTMDVHNLAAYQNAFRCGTDHLEARPLFVEHLAATLEEPDAVVVSPDVGGIKRAGLFRDMLTNKLARPVTTAFMEKRRSAGVVSGDTLVGDVEGQIAIIVDDLIASGTTIARAAKACRAQGSKGIYGVATHGVFVGGADRALSEAALDGLVVTDTIPPFRLVSDAVVNRLTVLDAASMFGEAIKRMHTGGSIVDLLGL